MRKVEKSVSTGNEFWIDYNGTATVYVSIQRFYYVSVRIHTEETWHTGFLYKHYPTTNGIDFVAQVRQGEISTQN